MSWQKEVDEIKRRRELARELGGADAVARQKQAGRLNVRERTEKLVDLARQAQDLQVSKDSGAGF